MITATFQFAGGTIIGRDHVGSGTLLVGKNNQDALRWQLHDSFAIGIVSDGCGSAKHSEIGATVGSALILSAASHKLRQLRGRLPPATGALFWEGVRRNVVAQLRVLASQMAGDESFSQVVRDHFLFTALVVVITEESTEIAGIGDGVFALNGEIVEIPSEEGNRPLYLGYDLVDTEFSATPALYHFKVHRRIATSEVQSVLIGTDGVAELARLSEARLPGRTEPIGPLSQFWDLDRYFMNPDAIRRRLASINSEVMTLRPGGDGIRADRGRLHDDTTVLVARRNPSTSHSAT